MNVVGVRHVLLVAEIVKVTSSIDQVRLLVIYLLAIIHRVVEASRQIGVPILNPSFLIHLRMAQTVECLIINLGLVVVF